MGRWARHATSSALYTRLAGVVAADAELLDLAGLIERRPVPNMLFAGVQYLLMTDPTHPLARYYPSLTPDPDPPDEGLAESFREFVIENGDRLIEIGRTRHTQTNECLRCTALLPGVWAGGHDRFDLIDIGASAGLNLALDRYRYSWDGITWGGASPVELATKSRGANPQLGAIEVVSRIGLDLHPVDPADPDGRAWLEALIWPEHHERRARLRAALEVASRLDIEMVPGDALETLPAVLARSSLPAVVMNSFSFNQLTQEQRREVGEIVAEARLSRPVHRVWLEGVDEAEQAALRVDRGQGWVELGRAHHHGEWLTLYARP